MDVFTQYAYNDTVFDNGTGSYNETEQDRSHPYNYYAMLLTLLIFVIVFGNVLVCIAVSREKALQTTTNYLIVSLAVADLLVATLVMPWVVYLEVRQRWHHPEKHARTHTHTRRSTVFDISCWMCSTCTHWDKNKTNLKGN